MQREPTDFIGWDFTFSSQAPRLEELKKKTTVQTVLSARAVDASSSYFDDSLPLSIYPVSSLSLGDCQRFFGTHQFATSQMIRTRKQ